MWSRDTVLRGALPHRSHVRSAPVPRCAERLLLRARGFEGSRTPRVSVLRYSCVEIHRSARKHGVDDETIAHAVDHAIVVVDLEPDADPPRVLAIGPDRAGNLLEIIWLEFENGPAIVIHAMALRRAFYSLLPTGEDD